jgi:hypothetical protein
VPIFQPPLALPANFAARAAAIGKLSTGMVRGGPAEGFRGGLEVRNSLFVWGVVSVCAVASSASGQSLELHLVTDPEAPHWVAIDFQQVLAESPGDRFLLGEVTWAETTGNTRFRLISDVYGDDPNFVPFVVPDRNGDGPSLQERFTTFLSKPRRRADAKGRFSIAAEPLTIGTNVITSTRLEHLRAIGDLLGTPGGYWARIAFELPVGIEVGDVYVAEQPESPTHKVLARGSIYWGTKSLQNDGDDDPSRDTAWVLAVNPNGAPAPVLGSPGDPNDRTPSWRARRMIRAKTARCHRKKKNPSIAPSARRWSSRAMTMATTRQRPHRPRRPPLRWWTQTAVPTLSRSPPATMPPMNSRRSSSRPSVRAARLHWPRASPAPPS